MNTVTITASGPAADTVEAREILATLRAMIADLPPDPEVLLVGPRPSRHERRRSKALARGRR